MPRYFFDICDGDLFIRDSVGTLCDGLKEARYQAMRALPSIALDKIPADGDRHAFTVLVRDVKNTTFYTATLIFAGLWIGDSQIPPQKLNIWD